MLNDVYIPEVENEFDFGLYFKEVSIIGDLWVIADITLFEAHIFVKKLKKWNFFCLGK